MKLEIHHYIELLALIASIIAFWKTKKWGFLHWFQPYLACILIVELLGKYVASVLKHQNAWIYNISIPIEYCFYSYICFHSVSNKVLKKIIAVLVSCFILFVVFTFLKNQNLLKFNSVFLFVGSGMMVLISCLFFWDLFNNSAEIRLLNHAQFWIFSGLLLFNLGEFTYNLFADMLFNQLDPEAIFFSQINNYLNLVLYLCISIGLLCRKTSPEE